MRQRLDKPWRTLDATAVRSLPGQLGVYQVAEPDGQVVRIGYAGGRSLFGLRGELAAELDLRGGRPALFRCEINMQYMSRYQELLMMHLAEHGVLPPGNHERADRLGRLTIG
jgi:hypothetical protein